MTESLEDLKKRYSELKNLNLKLDMTRGKPCKEQLDLANEMLSIVGSENFNADDGTDCRNYGVLTGIKEAKALFARMAEVDEAELIIGGNSSLTLMHDMMVRAMLFGVAGGSGPWKDQKVKFLCPVPGYDRHFSICEGLGIAMVPVEMNEFGPDMEQVEKLVSSDDSIKGMWCVPKYSNPTGVVYSDEVVDRLAQMKTASHDFRIFWDNAYTIHHLNGEIAPLKNILKSCKDAGHGERVYIFGSTSKVSFAGAGISYIAANKQNIDFLTKLIGWQTIGHDKLNQLRHVRFFKDLKGLHAHMDKHAEIIRPKFEAVQSVLEKELGPQGDFCQWTKPQGGYFISLDTKPGLAKKVVSMAGELGVKLTPAGATFPLKKDPKDCNIRIAPTLPGLEEIKIAIEVMAVCIKLATLDQ